jgi:hypothetical protein
VNAGPPPLEIAMQAARQGQAFSNGHEGEVWMAAWCGTCRFDDDGDGCVLTEIALLGGIPADWKPGSRNGLVIRYECEVYEPARPDRDVRVHCASLPGWPGRPPAAT